MSEPRPLVLTEDRWAGRLSLTDFPRAVEPLTRVHVPKHFNHRSPQARRDLASTLRNARVETTEGARPRRGRSPAADDEEITWLRRQLRAHPCHQCPDREEHARWAQRHHRLTSDADSLRARMEGRTHSIPRTFDRVCVLLEQRGYLDGDTVTAAGKQLARIWSEADLLVAECLRQDAWRGLSAPELAAAVSALLYESRRDSEVAPGVPGGRVREALDRTARIWSELADDERSHRLDVTREPDPGFAWAAYRWARGEALDRVLVAGESAGRELSAGDFVRWCKQLLDLLEQIAKVADPPLRDTAREACAALRRGVVVYTSVA